MDQLYLVFVFCSFLFVFWGFSFDSADELVGAFDVNKQLIFLNSVVFGFEGQWLILWNHGRRNTMKL